MFVVIVNVCVKEGFEEAFKEATIENASHSINEPGIARFDVIQQIDNPRHFVLIEVYRTEEDPAKHKETSHYKKWRETVSEMMEEPRVSLKYNSVFPDNANW